MNSICLDLECALGTVPEEKFAEEIGKFSRDMYDFRVLTKEREQLISLIRKVCTKEIDVKNALNAIKDSRQELADTRSLIKI